MTTDFSLPHFWAAVIRAPHLHADHLARALAVVGEPAGLWRQTAPQLQALGLPPSASALLADPPCALLDADLRWHERQRLRLLAYLDADYPPQLLQVPAAPAALYVRGSVAVLSQPQLALVGSRHPTAAGRSTAFEFALRYGSDGLVVTSGLAQGIDTAAHEGALAAGAATVAVCGTGLDRCYPAHNAALAERIAASGALLSEFAPGTPPEAANFPRRNRIISGLCRGTLVIEAARDSGSLITARRALEQGREVLAVPGSIRSPTALGCLDLLREGASLVIDPADAYPCIGLTTQYFSVPKQSFTASSAALLLDKTGEMLLDALGFEPAGLDELLVRTGLAIGPLTASLQVLELERHIESLPGGLYCRVR
ncbi:MAG: DNA-processing protein DprA [Proteobacteria bacterium]|nr:DNA-processing protein DprA [Pseudomonadota bacterium]